MGRHSAPADDAEDRSAVAVADDADAAAGADAAALASGRHAQSDSGDTGTGTEDQGSADTTDAPPAKPKPPLKKPTPSRAGRPPWPPRSKVKTPEPPASAPESAPVEAAVEPPVEVEPPSETEPPSEAPVEPPSEGLGLIEDALAAGPRPPAEPEPIDSAETVAVTGQIAPIVDPVADQPVPDAVTQIIPTISDRDGDDASAPLAELAGEAAAAPVASAADTPVATPPVETPPEAPVAKPAKAPRAGKGPHATSADLALVRHHSDVRARCIAGLLAPFIVYTALLLAIGSFGAVRYLLWIWIPLITAGVLIGLFLDAGHRRYDGEAARTPPASGSAGPS